MDTIVNSQRRAARILFIVSAFFAVMAVVPIPVGLDLERGGAPFVFTGIIFSFMFFFIGLSYIRKANKFDKLVSGEGLIAHWAYTEEEWQRNVDEQFTEESKSIKGIFIVVFVIFMLIALGLSAADPDMLPVIAFVFVALFIPIGFVAFVLPRYRYARDKKICGEFFVSPTCLLIGRRFYTFDGYAKRFDGVVLEAEPDPVLTFTYSVRGRHGRWSPQTIMVPVPRRELQTAQRIVTTLQKTAGPAHDSGTHPQPTFTPAAVPQRRYAMDSSGSPEVIREKRSWSLRRGVALLVIPLFAIAGYLILTQFQESNASIGSLDGHGNGVKQMLFTSDSRVLVTRNFDSFGEHIRPEIKIWAVAGKKLLRTIALQEETMDAMALSPDAKYVVTASLTSFDVRMITFRETASGKTTRTFPAYTDEISRLEFSAGGKTLIAVGSRCVMVWDLESGIVRDSLKTQNEARIAAYAIEEDSRVLMIVDSLGRVTMRDIASVVPLYSIPVERGDDMFFTGEFAFSKDAARFVTEKRDSIIVRETSTGNVIDAWYRHGGGTRTTEFSSDNKSILSHPGLNEVQVWNIAAHKCVIDKGGEDSNYGYFSPDGKRAIITDGKLVEVYDASNGTKLDSYKHYDDVLDLWGSVYNVACSPDNKILLSGRKKIRMWELK